MRVFLKLNRNAHPETSWNFVLININFINTCQVWSINILLCNIFFKVLYEKDGRFTEFINTIKQFHFHDYNTFYFGHENNLFYVCKKCNHRVDTKKESMFSKFYRETFCKTNYNIDYESENHTYN